MHVSELFDPDGIEWNIEKGWLSQQTSRVAPGLRILNYTHRCQYDRAWNECTLQCRGLILDLQGEVVARPFPKFFNAGEHASSDRPDLVPVDPDEVAVAYDKLDGSLGILYPDSVDGGHRVATRGSFTSDQALHATQVWKRKYEGEVRTSPGYTWLFEIIYPANRVVLDYGDMDDLVLLAVLDTETHRDLTPRLYWPGPRAEEMGAVSLRRALELAPRKNAEGFVLFYRDGRRVKVKQEDYVALHRIVTGLNKRRVWEVAYEAQVTGDEPEDAVRDLAAGLPDEFAAFVHETYRDLRLEVDSILAQAGWYFGLAQKEVDQRYRPTFAHNIPEAELARGRRKAFAEVTRSAPNPQLLFRLLDGKPIEAIAWKMVRPAAEAPREFSEATA